MPPAGMQGRTYGPTTKETCGMLIEGAYWYQESQRSGALDDYFMEEEKDKPLGWMSLPTALGLNGESVTSQANAREVALLETSQSFVTLNKTAFKNKDGVLQACLDFVRFMYSDARLRSFTRITGIAKGGMYYDLEDEDLETMNEYQQSVWALRSKNKVVLAGSNSPAYIARQKKIDINSLMGLWTPTILGTKYGSYIQAIRKDSKNLINAQNIFSSTSFKQSAW